MSTIPPTEKPEVSGNNRYSRRIDEAFEEASKLSGSNLPPTEFYEKFLSHTLGAIDAPAGVVWLRTPQGFLQIACQANLDKIGLDSKRGGRQCHNEILRQVFQSQPPRPCMIEPQGRLQGMSAEAGSVPAANLTDYYTLFSPIINQEKQSLGLLEIFQDPNHDPRMYQTFLQYSVQMSGYASQYHQYGTTRQSSGIEKLFTQIESFTKQIHSTLNPTETAYHVANEGRRLIECDRLCVAIRHGNKATVEAVSGADVVEKASTHVRRMRALFDAVLKFGDKLVYNGEIDDGLPPDLLRALDDYLAESQPKLLVVTPIRDGREKDESKMARSALLMESFNPPEQVEPMIQKLEVVGEHAAGALYNASEMKRIPFGFIWRPLAKLQEGLGGKNRFIAIAVGTLVLALILAMVLVPYPLKMEAKGEFMPRHVRQVYPPHEGEVQSILVEPGSLVQPGDRVVKLFSPELQNQFNQINIEIETAQKLLENSAGDDAKRGLTPEQESEYLRERTNQEVTLLAKQKELLVLRSQYNLDQSRPGIFYALAPNFDTEVIRDARMPSWRALSSDNRSDLTNRTIRMNEPTMRLGHTDGDWRVELKIPQQGIGHVKNAFATDGKYHVDTNDKKYLDVDVLLRSDPNRSYPGRLYEEDLAAEAIPNRDDHNESQPIVVAYVRVNLKGYTPEQMIPREQFVAGVEASTRIRCGNHAMGYSLFHGVYEWFYEKVVFFF